MHDLNYRKVFGNILYWCVLVLLFVQCTRATNVNVSDLDNRARLGNFRVKTYSGDVYKSQSVALRDSMIVLDDSTDTIFATTGGVVVIRSEEVESIESIKATTAYRIWGYTFVALVFGLVILGITTEPWRY